MANMVYGEGERAPMKEEAPSPFDPVERPEHYVQGSVECIDAIKAATAGLGGFEGCCAGNAVKYLWRWHRKGGVQDLRKARWYLDRLIASAEGFRS